MGQGGAGEAREGDAGMAVRTLTDIKPVAIRTTFEVRNAWMGDERVVTRLNHPWVTLVDERIVRCSPETMKQLRRWGYLPVAHDPTLGSWRYARLPLWVPLKVAVWTDRLKWELADVLYSHGIISFVTPHGTIPRWRDLRLGRLKHD